MLCLNLDIYCVYEEKEGQKECLLRFGFANLRRNCKKGKNEGVGE